MSDLFAATPERSEYRIQVNGGRWRVFQDRAAAEAYYGRALARPGATVRAERRPLRHGVATGLAPDLRVLRYAATHSCVTVGDVAEGLGVTDAAAARRCTRLARRGDLHYVGSRVYRSTVAGRARVAAAQAGEGTR